MDSGDNNATFDLEDNLDEIEVIDRGDEGDGENDEEENDGIENNGWNDGWFSLIPNMTAADIRGLQFDSEADAIDFYQKYAHYQGFAIRKDDVARDLNDNIIMRVLVCNREGKRRERDKRRVLRAREPKWKTRTNCRARLRVVYDGSSMKWKVSAFEELHNHDLTPSRFLHLMSQYRGLSDAEKAQADTMRQYGVKTSQIMAVMLGQAGGHANAGFLRKDLQNHFDKSRREKLVGGDVKAALSYLSGKAGNDRTMFSKFTRTNDRKLEHIVWADGASQIDYRCFGDVLAFDTTYKKNMYNRPLVIFSGSNHHRQTVIFGCALVANETAEAYKWVLRTFLEGMRDKMPQGVVTDGDGAMKEAIREVFPNAVHRICAWHLNKNAAENIKNKGFLEDFKTAMYGDFSVQEFKDFWDSMVEKHGLSTNAWVKKTYECKESWANAYFRGQFFARIRTMSQCEGINAFIKNYVSKKHSIVELMKNFDRALTEYRNNELIEDYNSMYLEPVLTTVLVDLERDAAKMLTRNMYYDVREQIDACGLVSVKERVENIDMVVFKIKVYNRENERYEVIYEKATGHYRCGCVMYESIGIPCSHIFCALKQENVTEIPRSLVCKRWTKDMKSEFLGSSGTADGDVEVREGYRRAALFASCTKLCHLAAKDLDFFKEVQGQICKLTGKIESRLGKCVQPTCNEHDVGDPDMTKTKGAPRKRKSRMKRRRCSHCGRSGHNVRKCPNIMNMNLPTSVAQSTDYEFETGTGPMMNEDGVSPDSTQVNNNDGRNEGNEKIVYESRADFRTGHSIQNDVPSGLGVQAVHHGNGQIFGQHCSTTDGGGMRLVYNPAVNYGIHYGNPYFWASQPTFTQHLQNQGGLYQFMPQTQTVDWHNSQVMPKCDNGKV